MKRIFFLVVLLFASLALTACNPLAKKTKSGLQVIITDSVDSSVYLNDNYVEKTPFINRELNPGEYKLKIQPDDPNLIPYEAQITLRPGLLTVVTWKLAQRPEFSGGVIYEMEPISSKNKSEISFVTIPDGAIVSVAGKDKTFSPVIIEDITPGHNEFEVSLPSYESQKHTINAIPGYRMLVTVKLAKINLLDTKEDTVKNASPSANTVEKSSEIESSKSAEPSIKTATSSAKTLINNLDNTKTGQLVKIKSTNFFINSKEVLRVRDYPGSSGKEIGFAEVDQTYPYLGKTENSWLNIEFDGKDGWVSEQYAQLVQ